MMGAGLVGGRIANSSGISDCVKTQFLEKPLSQNQQLTGTKSPKIGVFTQSDLLLGLDTHHAPSDRDLLPHPLGARTVEPAKGPSHGVVIGADRVLPATAAPSSIQGEVRANNLMEPPRPAIDIFPRKMCYRTLIKTWVTVQVSTDEVEGSA
jgi:hypothetical protein